MSTIDGEAGLVPMMVVRGQHVAATPTAIKAAAPSGSTFTFSATYSYTHKGIHISVRRGQTVSLSPEMKAILLAAGAPMVAA